MASDKEKWAQETIRRCRPILAVSVYHRQDHLWSIPLELAKVCKDYEFFLRPHGTEGWDLICYAVPVERLKRTIFPLMAVAEKK
jgi:hypothetical protein